MKHTPLLLLSAIVGFTICNTSCNGSGATTEQPIALYPDSASMPQAQTLVSELTPCMVAQSVIDWMKEADRKDGSFARRISRDIMYCYISEGNGDKAEAFSVALDSIKNTMTLPEQVHLFTVSATPEQLGRMIAVDPERDKFIPLIESAYAGDSTALLTFKNAFTTESTPTTE